jgi:hypothetical protein
MHDQTNIKNESTYFIQEHKGSDTLISLAGLHTANSFFGTRTGRTQEYEIFILLYPEDIRLLTLRR